MHGLPELSWNIILLKRPVPTARADGSMWGRESSCSTESHSTVIPSAVCRRSYAVSANLFPHLCHIVSITAVKVCQMAALLPPVGTNEASAHAGCA